MPADPQYDKVHELATPSSPYYGCHNKPRPVANGTVQLKDGYWYPFRHSTECKYDRSDTDNRCSNCKHAINKQEQVDEGEKPFNPNDYLREVQMSFHVKISQALFKVTRADGTTAELFATDFKNFERQMNECGVKLNVTYEGIKNV